MELKIEAIKHKDIRGKELNYLVVRTIDGVREVIINVGEKTFNGVKSLMEWTGEEKKEDEEGDVQLKLSNENAKKVDDSLADKLNNAENKIKEEIKKR